MRLIDADALKEKAKMRGHCLRPMITAYNLCVDTNAIDNAPTIAPEELRPRGEWEVTVLESSDRVFRTGAPHCNKCGRQAPHRTPFCPNCGADMRWRKTDGC